MKLAVVFGTRPEAIKMAPIIQAAQASEEFEILVVSTGQHRDMVKPLLEWFKFAPDIDLDLMQPGQTPQQVLASAISALDTVFQEHQPDAVLVQGDTSTALAGAIASFHRKIPVGHVEAGLRTGEFYSPFPEEMNRCLIGRMASWNFAPTERAATHLRNERVPGRIHIVGNTVVDALVWTMGHLPKSAPPQARQVLITAHRRESFGSAMREALSAIGELANRYPAVQFTYPVHPNPNVVGLATELLSKLPNVNLIAPVDYPEMVSLIKNSYLILSDSGGIQEEAPTFGVPILIMRESTERPEVVTAGIGTLVGTSREKILSTACHLLNNEDARNDISKIPNPYGDGTTARQVLAALQ
jgi:UDP-N-acetylglucosamine 2-epimerase (non-hydrolysing)